MTVAHAGSRFDNYAPQIASGFCPCGTRLPLGPWPSDRCPRCRAACTHCLCLRLTNGDMQCCHCNLTLATLIGTVPMLTLDDRRATP